MQQYSAATGSACSAHGSPQDDGMFPEQVEFFPLKLVSLETFSTSARLHHCYTAVLNPLAIILEQCLKMAVFAYEAAQHQVLSVANCTAGADDKKHTRKCNDEQVNQLIEPTVKAFRGRMD